MPKVIFFLIGLMMILYLLSIMRLRVSEFKSKYKIENWKEKFIMKADWLVVFFTDED